MRAWDSMETFAGRPMSEISTPHPRPLRDNRFAIISAPVGHRPCLAYGFGQIIHPEFGTVDRFGNSHTPNLSCGAAR